MGLGTKGGKHRDHSPDAAAAVRPYRRAGAAATMRGTPDAGAGQARSPKGGGRNPGGRRAADGGRRPGPDSGLTQAAGSLAKVFGWYDNEWGHTCRLADLAAIVGERL